MSGRILWSGLCEEIGFECEFPESAKGAGRQRQSPWDIRIEGVTFELKTATEDVSGSFQFNHIRYHREYEALLCVGISPNQIGFDAWSKAAVATGEAGKLVSMEKGGSGITQADQEAGPATTNSRFRRTGAEHRRRYRSTQKIRPMTIRNHSQAE